MKIPFAVTAMAVGLLAGCASRVTLETRAIGAVRAAPSCSVPPGHLPPPGQCRIWYADLPPGQQPPPGDCADLERRVPFDACLIAGN